MNNKMLNNIKKYTNFNKNLKFSSHPACGECAIIMTREWSKDKKQSSVGIKEKYKLELKKRQLSHL